MFRRSLNLLILFYILLKRKIISYIRGYRQDPVKKVPDPERQKSPDPDPHHWTQCHKKAKFGVCFSYWTKIDQNRDCDCDRKLFKMAYIQVILSAGAIHSPSILMLSGIGPKVLYVKELLPISYSNTNLLYKMGNYFLDIQ